MKGVTIGTILLVLILAVAIFGGSDREPQSRTQQTEERTLTSEEQARAAERFEDCRQRLEMAAEHGIIRDIPAMTGTGRLTAAGLDIVVDADVWRRIDYDTKVGMAEAINCWFLQGKQGDVVRLRFLDHRTHRVLGTSWGGLRLEVNP